MPADLRTLLDDLRATHFAAVAGATFSAHVPLSDALVTALVQARVLPGGVVRNVEVRAGRDNDILVRVRLTKPAFLPPFSVRMRIDEQPRLPASPILGLRLQSPVLGAIAGVLARLLPTLPPWMTFDGERVRIDVGVLAAQSGAAEVLSLLTHLTVTTEEGRFLIESRAALPPSTT